MSNKSTQILKSLSETINNGIRDIENGANEQQVLRAINSAIDKQFAKIVKSFGGNDFFYKKNNTSAWDLAMGDVI